MAETRTAEDAVEYTIYCGNASHMGIAVNDEHLLKLAAECMSEVERIAPEYIWHRDPMHLSPYMKGEEACLWGKSHIDENIEDEWFIIFLLFHLSKKYPEFVISVKDSDGEVLLIEAADHLPKWLKPETSENRVFISKGKLHIIPLPRNPAEVTLWPTGSPDISTAVQLVRGNKKSEASDIIQNVIQKRIGGYPENIKKLLHHAHCLIPANLAYALSASPGLIAPCVQAFYQRDPSEVKALRSVKNFPQENLLLSRVKFTKVLYSQVMQQEFVPFPTSGWKLPAQSSPSYKASLLGFKLVCGFELICNRYQKSQEPQQRPSGKRWEKYLEYLKSSGYFRGELEGSKLYKELLGNAELYFMRFAEDSTKKAMDPFVSVTTKLKSLLEESASYIEDLKRESKNLQPEDDDSWLTLSPEELDDMMSDIWGKAYSKDNPELSYQERLTSIVGGVKNFVDQISDFEGAEIPIQQQGHDGISFDGKDFLNAVSKMLDPKGEKADEDHVVLDTDPDSDLESDFSDEDYEDLSTCKEANESIDPAMSSLYQSMAEELRATNVGSSFETQASSYNSSAETTSEPLNVDLNLVKNFLESFSAQEGLPGPVSSLLQSMGMPLPPNRSDT